MEAINESLTRILLLRERHQALDDEADELSSRRWLTSTEQIKLKELKVLRLRVRDLISELEKEDDS